MCSCNSEEESTTHFLLRCPKFDQLRLHLINYINSIDSKLLNDEDLSKDTKYYYQLHKII